MELIIEHTTKYEYKNPVAGLIQTTKLHPSEYNGLKILEWNVHNDSAKKSKIYQDGEANNIQSFTSRGNIINSIFTNPHCCWIIPVIFLHVVYLMF